MRFTSDFQLLDKSELSELLAKHIADYEKLHLKGTKEEFEHCKPLIALLQQELKLRKQTS